MDELEELVTKLRAVRVVPRCLGDVTLHRVTESGDLGPALTPEELMQEYGLTPEDLRIAERPDCRGEAVFAGIAHFDETISDWV